jgi:transposase
MAHSVDLRERVVRFVRGGGSKAEAARRFTVARSCVYDWLKRKTLEPGKQGRRKRKLDWQALARHVEEHPEALLRERAAHFGVHFSAIGYALQQMKLSHKKNAVVPRKKL